MTTDTEVGSAAVISGLRESRLVLSGNEAKAA
jgi:hypothetical protein